jgi:predicted nucleic acid-binding protein
VAAAYRTDFVDSSALVKRYVQEIGTAWVRRLTRHNPSTIIYIARITVVEVTSAVARRRKGTPPLAPSRASSILRRFRQHLDGRYTVIEITPALLDEAARRANAHTLRAYDAVQLAALEINRKEQDAGFAPVTLISADRDLNAAATAEGLAVDDPNRHP